MQEIINSQYILQHRTVSKFLNTPYILQINIPKKVNGVVTCTYSYK